VLHALAAAVTDVARCQQSALEELKRDDDGAERELAIAGVLLLRVGASLVEADEEGNAEEVGAEGKRASSGEARAQEPLSALEALRRLLVERLQMAQAYEDLTRRHIALQAELEVKLK
jgi:hypothetical protein